MKKILFIDTTHPYLPLALKEAGFRVDENYGWTEKDIISNLREYTGIVIRSRIRLTKEILTHGKNLEFIARVGAGMENIDVDFAESIGIKCLHAPEGNRDAVGEHAVGMLLSLMNNIVRADAEVRNGKWNREFNRGTELMGKTVGIIGYGNMGSAFAQRLSGFGVRILAYDKYKTGFGSVLAEESSLENIFENADVLSLHTPLTEETLYMVNAQFLSSFRKNIWLINTARGKSVKISDLADAIRSGKVRGACLDVLEFEATSFENLADIPAELKFLFESDKVVFTPHVAGWSFESNEKLARVLVEKILALRKD